MIRRAVYLRVGPGERGGATQARDIELRRSVETRKAVKNGAIAVNEAIKQNEWMAMEEERQAEVARNVDAPPPVTDRYSLYNESCIAALGMEPESVDWVIADPPYGRNSLRLMTSLA